MITMWTRASGWKKQKELQEARKAGTVPATVDEEGRDINPHIPSYIAQPPWYVSLGRPSLSHQRIQNEVKESIDRIESWYVRGETRTTANIKYRPGACENCGAKTHKKKDCLERPRKTAAKFTNKDIKEDEYIHSKFNLSFDAKRDRWNGCNAEEEQKKIIDEYNKTELVKQKIKTKKLLISVQLSEETVNKTEGGDGLDEDKYVDEVDMPGTKFDSKTRTTVRNLRIREDTAKYLYNFDPKSPFYDPKSRSMRENPLKNMNKDPSELKYAGENFTLHTGDVMGFAHQQMFAWDAYKHGTDVHPEAEPTALTLMQKEFNANEDEFKTHLKQSILSKYGGDEHLDMPAKELFLAQTEEYVEYSRLGKVIKRQKRAIMKSRYQEDVYINNHTSVWGSYWEGGNWGYECCHSNVKLSFCLGKIARKAVQADSGMAQAYYTCKKRKVDPIFIK